MYDHAAYGVLEEDRADALQRPIPTARHAMRLEHRRGGVTKPDALQFEVLER